ncbi:MAG: DUF2357 domain-containing protein [Christensenellaceae bacterium]|jgi:hypothetical protein|nr:DUF2357 domain-containing protein [Christensenellaceae bacterium]
MARLDQYEAFIAQINTILKQNEFYSDYMHSIREGKSQFILSQVFTKKNYTSEWIDRIEECLPSLDTIVRNPRKFIVIEEDIVDVSLARSISVESVKHLAQHTNLINSVKKDGTVIPSKILNTSKEESFEIYENRFIYTLLLKTKDFIDRRFEILKKALIESGELGVSVKTEFHLDEHKVGYDLSANANFPFDSVLSGSKSGQLTDTERLTRINMIFSDFLNSAFAKEMRDSAPVRPPIQRTNVILKDPNFKNALMLWQFVESNENMKFEVKTDKEEVSMPTDLVDKYKGMVFFNTLLLQSIAASRGEGASVSAVKEQEKRLADEYVTKNIDDFVPDDFPHLKMELSETRRIYYKVPGEKAVKLTEVSKMNAAIDRVIRQYKINKAKAESAMQKRLIARQLREEEEAKRIALREARAEELRQINAEKERIKAEKKLEEERIAHEKWVEAELLRLEEERQAAEARAEEARIAAEKIAESERARIEAEVQLVQKKAELKRRMEADEMRKKNAIDAASEALRRANTIEAEMIAQLEFERIQSDARVKEEAERVAKILMEQLQAYWNKQKDLAIRLMTEERSVVLNSEQLKSLNRLKKDENGLRELIAKMKEILENSIKEASIEGVEKLVEQAKSFRPETEVMKIRSDFEAGIPTLNRLLAKKRLEIFKTQLEVIKERLAIIKRG